MCLQVWCWHLANAIKISLPCKRGGVAVRVVSLALRALGFLDCSFWVRLRFWVFGTPRDAATKLKLPPRPRPARPRQINSTICWCVNLQPKQRRLTTTTTTTTVRNVLACFLVLGPSRPQQLFVCQLKGFVRDFGA